MIHIVFDTTELFNNWWLDSPNFKVLERLVSLEICKLYIPEIVLIEAKNKYKEEISKKINEARSVYHLLPQNIKHVLDKDKLIEEYESNMHETISRLNIAVPSFDDISQNLVTSRLFSLRKPFNSVETSDKGYRDTLCWETIISKIAKEDETTFFITNNYNDYAKENSEFELHDDLKEDLVKKGLPDISVVLCKNLSNWISTNGKEYLKTADIADELKTGNYDKFSIEEWFNNSEDLFIEKLSKNIFNLIPENNEIEDPSITCIEDPTDIVVEQVLSLDNDTLYLEIELKAAISIDFLVDKNLMERNYNFPILIWDDNWNEYYSFAGTYFQIPIRFSATFDIESNDITDIEIEDLNYEIFGYCPHCGAPILNDAAEGCSKCGKDFF